MPVHGSCSQSGVHASVHLLLRSTFSPRLAEPRNECVQGVGGDPDGLADTHRFELPLLDQLANLCSAELGPLTNRVDREEQRLSGGGLIVAVHGTVIMRRTRLYSLPVDRHLSVTGSREWKHPGRSPSSGLYLSLTAYRSLPWCRRHVGVDPRG